MLSPQVVQAVQRLQHPPQHHKGAVLIRAPPGTLTHVQQAQNQAQNQGQNQAQNQGQIGLNQSQIDRLQMEEPRDLSAKPSAPVSLPISFLPHGQRSVAFVQQQAPQPSYKGPQLPPQAPQIPPQTTAQAMARLPPGSSISLTNSVELSPRPVGPEFLQQRIDKVISENQAIVETWDSLHLPQR